MYIYIYISTYAASARLQRAWPDLAGAQRSASRPIVTHTQRVNIWVKNTHIQLRAYITLHYTTSHHIITSHDTTLHTYIHTYVHTYIHTYVRTCAACAKLQRAWPDLGSLVAPYLMICVFAACIVCCLPDSVIVKAMGL